MLRLPSACFHLPIAAFGVGSADPHSPLVHGGGGSGPRMGWLAVALSALAIVLPAAFFVAVAESWSARLFELSVTSLFVLLWVWGWRRRLGRRPMRLFAATAGLGIMAAVGVAALAPSGTPLAGSRVQSVFLGPQRFPRWSIANLVPEIDQMKVGTYVMPAADRILTRKSAARLRSLSMGIYRPMEADPEFAALGSVMAYAYTDQESGHLYRYVPPHAPGEKLPLLLFLHGSGGNFKAYFYLWRSFADRHRYVVVCPSFGFGNWYKTGGVQAIDRALEYAKDHLPVDGSRVFLAGLSNGGTGATRVAAAHPGHFAGLVLLSAVMEQEVIQTDEFRDGWSGRPVLILHGDVDDRISLGHAQHAAESMRSAHVQVTLRTYAQEDHFLIFSQPDLVMNDIATWASAVPSLRP